jgi:hypothetical protein
MKRNLVVSIARQDIGIIHTTILNLADLSVRNKASVMLADGTVLDLHIAYEVTPTDA